MTPLVVVVPMRLPSAANLREHWAVKAKREREQRRWTGLRLRTEAQMRPSAAGAVRSASRVRCTLTRVGPRQLDSDNVSRAFKAVRDEVAAWVGVDDGDEGCDGFWVWMYEQRKGLYAVEIRLEVTRE